MLQGPSDNQIKSASTGPDKWDICVTFEALGLTLMAGKKKKHIEIKEVRR